MTPILEVRNLTKHYRLVQAVKGISFSIPAGICFGLLGPNGAGKSTTIEMIEGIKQPTGGEILYKGAPRGTDFAQQCGIQFQSTALPDFLQVREVLALFHSFYSKTLPIDELVTLCDLGEFLDNEANRLSGGQKQRLLLALALINDPEIVFLDEPTTGLDPQSRRRFWYLIDRIKKQGKTVILTTHYMDEAESLCDDLIIIDHGTIIDQGSPQSLLQKHLPHRQVSLNTDVALDTAGITGEVNRAPGAITIDTLSVEKTLQELMACNADLSSLRVHNPTLEDLFIKLTGHALRE
ncbi:ABC transporter ATP-binding protein [Litorivivens sp.]|uniref:ABC transporter ATP-binding protein n=2 Tax=Litorivivens sp. TaxID=2020868 RepID=UPI0035698B6A